METAKVPGPWRERLGDGGTSALLDLLDATEQTWRDDVVTMTADRFERRLADECNRVRLEMANGFADLRQAMVEGHAALRREMVEGQAALRSEMHQGMANVRVEVIKWSFAFWLAQIVTLAAVFSRAFGR